MASANLIVGDDFENALAGGAGRDLIYGFDPNGPQGSVSSISASLVASGLSAPVFVGAPAGDPNRLFMVEQSGLIKILNTDTQEIVATPFLDVSADIEFAGAHGLLGLAFHPDFAENGYFYVNMINTAGDTEIRRYQASAGNPNVADPIGTPVITIAHEPGPQDHKAGWLGFGPDGYLYAALGDGNPGDDPFNHAQNVDSLWGKILRLDVNADAFPGDPLRNYASPDENPFVDTAGADEIYALGLRNPWRDSFDRALGDFYIADVGEDAWEEINLGASGANYGWDAFEGPDSFEPKPLGGGTLTSPIYSYGHDVGVSVIGGYVYRGPSEGLHGQYLFADFGSGRFFTLQNVAGTWEATERTDQIVTDGGTLDIIVSFGEDGRGNLYAIDYDGDIFRLMPAAASADQGDNISAAGGDDFVFGGSGDDVLNGGDGNDIIDGGKGDDFALGGPDRDALFGGDGDDYLSGEAGDDTISGDGGDDVGLGGDGDDRAFAGDGMDAVWGEGGDDTIDGGDGNDFIFGGDGDDTLAVGAGDNYAEGGAGDDDLKGGGGNDYLAGGADNDTITGNGGSDIGFGGDGDDELSGGDGIDALWGEDGADTIEGGGENDFLFGGDGNDTIVAGAGANYAEGGEGDDTISGGDGDDYLLGGADDDIISSAGGSDVAFGGDGADRLSGGDGPDALWGEGDGDIIDGGAGVDFLFGGDGDDTISDTDGATHAEGGSGDDLIGTGGGDDYILAGSGADVVESSGGSDLVLGEDGDDRLFGGGGNDGLFGGLGADSVDGGDGNDFVFGNEGADVLAGGSDNDSLFGGSEDDTVNGGSGDDYIEGNEGNDTLGGDAGRDLLIGGGGEDVFIFRRGEAHGDTVWDFAGNGAAIGDTLRFVGYGAGTFVQLDATHWSINSSDGQAHEVITIANGAPVAGSDYLFV